MTKRKKLMMMMTTTTTTKYDNLWAIIEFDYLCICIHIYRQCRPRPGLFCTRINHSTLTYSHHLYCMYCFVYIELVFLFQRQGLKKYSSTYLVEYTKVPRASIIVMTYEDRRSNWLSFSFPFPQFYFEIVLSTHNLENIVSQFGKVNWDDGNKKMAVM